MRALKETDELAYQQVASEKYVKQILGLAELASLLITQKYIFRNLRSVVRGRSF